MSKTIPFSLSYTLAVLICLFSIIFWVLPPDWMEALAFFPGDPARFFGMNLLSCFLVHADLASLLASFYGLILFGDRVEEDLGKTRYLLLLLLTTFSGSLLSGMYHAGELLPQLGAGGGVFGILVYYLLRSPYESFTFRVSNSLLTLPASTVVLGYLGLQLFGSVGLPFLGGAAAAAIYWFFECRELPTPGSKCSRGIEVGPTSR